MQISTWLWNWLEARRQRRARQTPLDHAARLSLRRLEERQVLNATAGVIAGALDVQVTDANQTVTISVDSGGHVHVDGSLDGHDNQHLEFDAGSFSSIHVTADAAANQTVVFDGTQALNLPGSITVDGGFEHVIVDSSINAGEGINVTADDISFQAAGDLTSLHAGITLDATTDVTLDSGASLHADHATIGLYAQDTLTMSIGSSIIDVGGTVILDAGLQGTLYTSGTIDASDHQSGDTGGTVHLLGERVALLDGADVDASGDAGGGTVLIGGDYHGDNAVIHNALRTYVGHDTTITADAITTGDGGKVIVWSDATTQFYGDISAHGGQVSGDGGFVETSGKEFLEIFGGSVTATATNGTEGVWLLDPHNVTITNTTSGGTFDSSNPNLFTPSSDSATVDAATIEASLKNGTSVTVTTGTNGTVESGDVTVDATITKSAGTTATFIIDAANAIIVNYAITGSSVDGTLNVNFYAGAAITINAAMTVDGNMSVIANGAITEGAAGTLAVTGTTSLTAGSANNITLDNGNDFTGDVTVVSGNDVTLNDINGLQFGGTSTVSGKLVVTTAGAITEGAAGTLAVTGTTSLTAGSANNITLDNGNDFTGDVTVVSGNDVTLNDINGLQFGGTSTVSGKLVVTTAGAITEGAAGTLAVTGTTSLTAGSANNITLDNGNDFTGDVTVVSGNDVTLNDINGLQFGGTSTVSGKLVVTTAGAITEGAAGTLAVTGTTSLTAGSANDITLDNGNDFTGDVTVVSGNDVTLNDINGLQFGGTSTVSGKLVVTTAGAITEGAAGTLAVTGTTSLTAGSANNITLDNGNDFTGDVTVVSGNDVTLNDINGLQFGGTSTVSGKLVVTTAGAITEGAAGTLAVTGTTSLTAGSANNITLDNGNDFTGDVTVVSGNDVTLNDINGLQFGGTSTVSGKLVVTTAGAITEGAAGTLAVTGTTSLTAGSANNITLDNGNDFTGDVTVVSGNDVTLNDINGLQFGGTSTVSGKLVVTTAGAITEGAAGTLAVTGTTSLTAGSANNITLDNGNDFTGDVTVVSGNDVTLNDINGLQFGGTSTVSGKLVVTTAGAITEGAAGTLAVTGTTSLTAGSANNITLDNGNDFTGDVTVVSGNDVTLNDINGLQFGGTSTVSGKLVVTTAGAITEGAAGTLAVTGTTSLTAGSANNITLDNGNDFTGDVTVVSGNDVTLNDINGLQFGGTSTVSGKLVVTTAGAITEGAAGTLAVTGTTSLTAGSANNITLDNGNDFTGDVTVVSGNDVTLNDINGLQFGGTSTVSGKLVVTTAGAITEGAAGTLAVTGTTSLTAGSANNITLDNGNDFTGDVTVVSGNDVTLNDINGLQFGGTSTVSGKLVVTTAGAITEGAAGTLAVTGTTSLTAGSANNITLDNGNDFTGDVTVVSGNDVTLNDINGLQFGGTSTVSGKLVVTTAGAITEGAAGTLAVTGTTSLTAGSANNITLDNGNDFTGDVTVVSGNDVTLNDINGLQFGGTSTVSGKLVVTTAGAITEGAAGTLAVTGTTSLTAGSANNITLDNGNDFTGDVTVVSGNDVTLNDINGLQFGGTSTVSGKLVVTTAGAITEGAAGTLAVTGTTSLTAGSANNITLDNGNDFTGDVTVVSGNDVTLNDINGLQFGGTSTVSGKLVVTTAGAITEGAAGTLAVTGTTSLTAGSANNITLDNGNDFTGDVTVVSGNDVTLNDINGLQFGGTSTVSGKLVVTTAGAITEGAAGTLAVTGTTSLTAGSANNITLDNGNDFTGDVTVVSGNDVTLNDINGLQFGGTSTVSGKLVVTTAGAITEGAAGTLAVTGTTSLTAGSANNITLDNGNDFTGDVTVVSGNDVTLNDINGLQFGGTSTVSGKLVVTTAGAITEGAAGTLAVTGTTSLTAGSANNITLDNGNDFTGDVTVVSGNDVTLNDINGLQFGGTSTVSGKLVVTTAGAITEGAAGTLAVTGTTSLTAGSANNITLDNGNDFTGDVTVVSGNDVTLNDINGLQFGGTSTVSGKLVVTTAGAITDGAAGTVKVTGTTSLTAGAGNDITLDNGNDFVGDVTVVSGNDVTLNDINALQFGGTSTVSGKLVVTTAGAITDGAAGTVKVTGTTSLTAGAGNNITLDNGNDFTGDVTVVSGNDVTLNDINGLQFGGTSTVSGKLVVTTAGAITEGAAGTLAVTGTTSLTAGSANNITLDNGNDFTGDVTVVSGNDVTLNDINGLQFGGTSTVSGKLVVTTAGAITEGAAGTLAVTGTTSLTAGSANNITLDNGNDFTGDVTVVSGNDVTLNDINGLQFGGTSTVSGKLVVTTAGAITEGAAGTLAVTGTTSLTAGSANNITLDNGNDFTGDVTVVSGNDVTLNDINGLQFGGTSTVSGKLVVTTAGAITEGAAGTLAVTGTTSLTAGSANNITLDNGNDFTGDVTVVSGNDVTLNDINGLQFGGTSTVSGKLVVTTAGAITEGAAGTLAVTGTTSLTAGSANNITLDNGNDFTGDVTVVSGNDVTLNDINGLQFGGTSTVSGKLVVTTAGAITEGAAGTLAVTGTTSLTAGSANNITLDNGNDFTGDVTVVSGNDVTLNDINGLQFGGTSTVSGKLVVTTAGAITEGAAGTLAVTGTTSLTAGSANNITLDNGNDFTGDVTVVSGNDVTLNDINGLQFGGTSTVSGKLVVTTAGAITEGAAGTLAVTGTTSLTAGSANNITLDNGNDFTGDVTVVSGNDVTLNDINGLQFGGTSTVSGKLVVTTAGAITEGAAGTLAVTGTTSLTAGSANNITLDNGNDFTGDVTVVSGNDVTLNDINGLQFGGTSTVSGKLVVTAGGTITNDSAASVTVTGNASFHGSAITLGTTIGDNMNFGSLTFVSTAGGVTISEDSDTVVSGTSSVSINSDLSLTSTGSITNDVGTSLTVSGSGGNASFSGTSITLGNNPTDVMNFGSLTVTSSGAVNITEDSNTVFAGSSTAGSLTIKATGSISDGTGGDISVTGVASFTATDEVTLGDNSGNTENFGSLTVDAGTTVNVTEASDMTVNTISGTAITLVSTGVISEAFAGTISTTGLLTTSSDGGTLFNGANTVGSFMATNSTSGNVELTNTATTLDVTGIDQQAAGTVDITNAGAMTISSGGSGISATSGKVTLIANGGSSTIDIDAGITTTSGAVDVTAGSTLTVNQSINTGVGFGGVIMVKDAVLNAALVAGAGNITLNGGGQDLIINVNQSSSTTLMYEADRDIIIRATITTTGAGSDIVAKADFDNNGVGGFWLDEAGSAADAKLVASGSVSLSGSDLFANAADARTSLDAVRISADGSNTQIVAVGSIDLSAKGITSADIVLDGKTSAGTTLTVTADTGRAIYLSGDQSADTGMTFNNDVVLTQNVALTTGTGAGDITFVGKVNADAPSAETLHFTAGSGTIAFQSAVGDTNRLGAITVISARDVDVDGTLKAASFTLQAGSGTTTFKNAIDLDAGATGNVLSLTNVKTVVFQTSATVTTAHSGNVSLDGTSAGTLTIGTGSMNLDGSFIEQQFTSASTASNITTTGDHITFGDATSLTGNVTLSTGAGVGGNVAFSSTLDSASHKTLAITAGTGDVTFTGAVGGANQLGSITINNAHDVAFTSTVATTNDLTQVAGTGTTTFHGTTGMGIGGQLSITTDAITLDTATVTTVGAVTMNADDAITFNAGLNAGASTIAINANTAGTDASGFSQTTGTIQTSNATGSAISITVNNASGDTGSAAVQNIQTGDGGTLAISTAGGGSTTGGSITQSTGTLDVGSGTITLNTPTTGASGIGTSANPIMTNVGSVMAAAGGGGVYITEVGTGGGVNFTASATGSGNVELRTASGLNNNLTVAGAVTTDSGNILISSDDAVLVNANIGGAGTSGTITILTNQDATGSDSFTQTSGTIIQTTNNTANAVAITVAGTGNAAISDIRANTASGVVTITAADGAITDNLSTEAANVTADKLAMVASTGIGSADNINTGVSELAFANSTSGQTNVSNTGSLLTVQAFGAVASLNSFAGGAIASNHAVTVASALTYGGTLSLTAGDSATVGDNLVINANITGSGTGQLNLQAGDDITLAASLSDKTICLVADHEGALDADRGGIQQTAGTISSTSLGIIASDSVNLGQTGNQFGTVAAQVTGSGSSLTLVESDGFTVGTACGVSGLTTNNGDISVTIGAGTGGLLTVGDGTNGQDISAGTGTVTLNTAGVTETTGSTVSSDKLLLLGTGTFSLNESNTVNTLAVNVSGTLSYRDTDGLIIGTVGSTSGITNDADVRITTGGNLTIGIGADANATGITITGGNDLTLAVSGTVTQASTDLISASGLQILGSGNVNLDNANLVTTLAANHSGTLSYHDADTLTIGTVTDTALPTTATSGITNNADVKLTTGGLLTIGTGVGQDITALGVTVTLNTGSAGVTEAAGSIVSTNNLLLLGNGTYSMGEQNTVGTLAADINGSINYVDADALVIGSVNGTNGISTGNPAAGGDVSITTGGVMTVNQSINTTTGSGGLVSVANALLNAALVAGKGNITLSGGGDNLIVTADQSSATTLTYSARCDIIVGATITTTSGASMSLTADSDGDGMGGVQVLNVGQLNSTGSTTLHGSDLCATTTGAPDSVRIDADGSNDQILAVGNITIAANAAAPNGAEIVLDGRLHSTTGDINVTSKDTIQADSKITADLGNVNFHSPVVLTGDEQIIAGGNVTFDKSTNDDGTAATSNLTITAGGDVAFYGNVGDSNALTSLTVTGAKGVFFGDADHGTATAAAINTVRTIGVINIGSTSSIGSDGIVFDAGNGNTLTVTTNGSNVRLSGPITLDSDLMIDTGSGVGDITFTNDSPVDSATGETNDLTLNAGTGQVRFNEDLGGTQRLGSLIVENASRVTFGEADTETVGAGTTGPVNVVNTNEQINLGSQSVITGGIVLNGGTVNSANDPLTITTTNDAVRFNGAVTLATDVRIDTGSGVGDITFTNDSPVDSATGETNDLVLNAGTGQVRFNEDLGGTQRLGSLIVENASRVTFGEADTETVGAGSTGPVNVVNTNEQINLGSQSVITGGIVLNGGTVNSANDPLTITTTNDAVRFNGAVTLATDVRIDTGSGVGDITFTNDSPVDSATGETNDLVLNAGTGQVRFNEDLGGTQRLGSLIVENASRVTFGEADTETVGAGTTGPVNVVNTNEQIDLGSQSVITGGIVLNGGTVNSANDPLTITTTNDAVRFNGAVTLATDVRIDTGSGVGDITFTNDSPVDSATGETNDLVLNAGTGQVRFNEDLGGTQRLGSLIVENASRVTFGEADTETVGAGTTGPVNVVNTNEQINLGSQSVITGGIVLNGGTVNSANDPLTITTTNDAVRFNGAVTLATDVRIDTGSGVGDITFTNDSPVDSATGETNDLVLNAGTGQVRFNEDLGGTQRLGSLIVENASRVTFGEANTETVGAGTTGPVNVVNTNEQINLGSQSVITGGIVLNGGTVNSANDPLTITTTNDAVRFNGAVTLATDVRIDTGSGVGDITFTNDSPVDSATGETNDLVLNAGTGQVRFNEDLGGTQRLGSLIVENASRVTFGEADTETVGAGSTGPVNVVNTNEQINLGSQSVITGGIVLNGGTVNSANDPLTITTTNDAVRFNGAVTLATDVRIDTGSGVGDITFTNDSPVDSATGETNDLVLNAGTGQVRFNEDLGGTQRLGSLIVENASRVTFGEADTETVGAGTTGPVNVVNTNEQINLGSQSVITGGIVLNGGTVNSANDPLTITTTNDAVRFNGAVTLATDVRIDTGSGVGDITFTNDSPVDSATGETNDLVLNAGTGQVRFNEDLGGTQRLGSLIVENASRVTFGEADTETVGAGSTGPVNVVNTNEQINLGSQSVITGGIVLNGGTVNSANDPLTITTTNDAVRFNGAVTLATDVRIDTGSGVGDITFTNDSPVDSATGETNDLTLNAGTGQVRFNEDLGGTQRLGSLIVENASRVTFGEADTETVGAGTTGPVNVVNTNEQINLGSQSVITGGIVLNGGTVNSANDPLTITTTNDAVRFNGAVTLATDVRIDTGSGVGDITFTNDSPVDSATGETNDLTLNAGTGQVRFNEDLGGTQRLGSLIVENASRVTFGEADTETVGAGTTGPVNVVNTNEQINLGSQSVITGGIVLNGGTVNSANDPLTITTTNDAVRFNGAVTLATDVRIDTGSGVGDITFTNDSPVDSATGETNDLVLNAGTGQVRFNEDLGGTQRLGSLIVENASRVTFGEADTETVGAGSTGPVNVVNTNEQINLGSQSVITGGIVLNGGTVNSANDPLTITTTNDAVRFNGAVTLATDVRIDTGSGVGDITFTNDSPVDSATGETNDLTLNAGTGQVRFNEDLGGTQRLGSLIVENASRVTFGEADTETVGAGSTGPVNVVNTNEQINLGSQSVITGGIVLNGGTVNSANDPLTITTTNDAVRFNGAVTLATDVRIDTGSGVGDITFTNDSPVDSATGETNDLTLNAGTGQVRFNEDLGGTQRLGSLIVENASRVTFGEADTETVGAGSTGPVNVVNTNEQINLGSQSVITGGIVLNGGTVNSANDPLTITTTNDAVRFNGAVTLATDVRIDTGSGVGDITFTNDSPVDSQAGERNDLTLTAGTGDIEFAADVGNGVGGRLGDVLITQAHDVTVDATGSLNATTLTQDNGTGTTTFSGPVNTDTTNPLANDGIRVRNDVIVVNSAVSTDGSRITLTADSMEINPASGSLDNTASGLIQLWNKTAGTSIDLGSETPGSLSLTNSELETIHTGTLQIGRLVGDTDGIAGNDIIASGKITVSSTISLNPTANTTTLSLRTAGDVVAGSSGLIQVQQLGIETTGRVSLPNANDVNVLTANVTGVGQTFDFHDANTLQIGRIDPFIGTTDSLIGLTTNNGDARLTVGGTLNINEDIAVGTGDLTLNVGTRGTQTTGSDGIITANGLQLLGSGQFELQNTSNNVNTIAGTTGGQIHYTDADNLAIGVVSSSLNSSSSGIMAPGQLVSLTSVAGSLTDGNGAAMNVTAGSLALRAVTGIGSGDAIETSVSQLAAHNTGTGSIQIDNTGTPLTIERVDGIHGISKSGVGADAGNIVVTNDNSITVSNSSSSTNAPLTNSTGGSITLTATGAASDVTINSPIAASGGNGNVILTAGRDLIVNDTGVTNDISLVGNGTAYLTAANRLTLGSQDPNATPGSAPPPDANNVIVKTATGTITNTLPLVYNIAAPQITATGEVVLSGDFGRPGEHNITITAYWGDGSSTTQTFADPGHFSFSHFYHGNPTKDDTSAPILINVQVSHDPHVVLTAQNVNAQADDQYVDNPALPTQASPQPPAPYINADLSGAIYNSTNPNYVLLHGDNTKIVSAAGTEANPVSVTFQDTTVRALAVSVPGEGLATFPFDVTPPVVYLHFPEQVVVIDHVGVAPLQLSQQDTLRLDLAGAADAVAAERVVILEILREGHTPELIRLPEHVLDHLLDTIQDLPDGRYRFQLLEPGESRSRPLLDEFDVRGGKIVDENDTGDRPPSSATKSGLQTSDDAPAVDADQPANAALLERAADAAGFSVSASSQVGRETDNEPDAMARAAELETSTRWNGWSSQTARRAWKRAGEMSAENDEFRELSAPAAERWTGDEQDLVVTAVDADSAEAGFGSVAFVGAAAVAGMSVTSNSAVRRTAERVGTRLNRAARLFRKYATGHDSSAN